MLAVPVYFILFSNLILQSTSRRFLLNATRGIPFSSYHIPFTLYLTRGMGPKMVRFSSVYSTGY